MLHSQQLSRRIGNAAFVPRLNKMAGPQKKKAKKKKSGIKLIERGERKKPLTTTPKKGTNWRNGSGCPPTQGRINKNGERERVRERRSEAGVKVHELREADL